MWPNPEQIPVPAKVLTLSTTIEILLEMPRVPDLSQKCPAECHAARTAPYPTENTSGIQSSFSRDTVVGTSVLNTSTWNTASRQWHPLIWKLRANLQTLVSYRSVKAPSLPDPVLPPPRVCPVPTYLAEICKGPSKRFQKSVTTVLPKLRDTQKTTPNLPK